MTLLENSVINSNENNKLQKINSKEITTKSNDKVTWLGRAVAYGLTGSVVAIFALAFIFAVGAILFVIGHKIENEELMFFGACALTISAGLFIGVSSGMMAIGFPLLFAVRSEQMPKWFHILAC